MKTTSWAMIFIAIPVIAITVIAIGPSSNAQDTVLIQAASVHLGNGDVLSPAQVLVRDGKIERIAEKVAVKNAQVIKVQHLIPGLIDAAARTGISQLDKERTKEITPELSTAAIVDWTDRRFTEHLSSGTTTLHLIPGTDNVVSGLASIAKTSGPPEGRMVSNQTGLTISMCSDPASGNRARSRPDSIYIRQPTNRMGVVWMLRATFHASQAGKNKSTSIKAALAGDLPVFSVSRTQYDIQALLTLADEFSFAPIVIGGQEAWQVTAELAERKIPVILQPTTPGSSKGTEGTRISAAMAAKLNKAGVPFCLSGGDLLNQARFAVRYGLPKADALKAITASPASILKINDQVGAIATGKDADFVALNGDPLEFTTAIQWVMVNGQIQFEQVGN